MYGMVKKRIFLSVAAIDRERAERYRWLPSYMFPLLTHRIAASGRTHDGDEFAFVQCKRYVRKSGSLAVQGMVGIMDVFEF